MTVQRGQPAGGGGRGERAVSAWRSKAVGQQAIALALGAALLACAAFVRSALETRRTAPDSRGVQLVREDPESEKKLSSMAVTFPRLTLGGMRGVVAAYLWKQAEEDKDNRNWMDLETKYDLIGALQPYFVSVYVYHSWNQAYNLSAQWQDEETKYKWVLDGEAYLYKGEDFNPGNPDIVYEQAQLYAMKLGGAAERQTYRAHWRSDISRLHELNGRSEAKNDATVALKHVRDFVTRRDSRDPPGTPSYFHTEELPDPAEKELGAGWGLRIYPDQDRETGFNLFKDRTDGKAATAPMDFRYGLSPFYFGYIEYKRCVAIGKRPSSMGLRVVDAWPAMSLRLWVRDDIFYTGLLARAMFGLNPVKAMLVPEAFTYRVLEARDCGRNVQMIAPRAVELFNGHLSRYPENKYVHTKHIRETESMKEISKAEMKLFDALVLWHNNGRTLTGTKGPEVIRALMEADELYKAAYPVTMTWVNTAYPAVEGQPINPDRADMERYANALMARSKGIEAMLTTPAGQAPDMAFLNEDVVER
jgi:hypothetical protein